MHTFMLNDAMLEYVFRALKGNLQNSSRMFHKAFEDFIDAYKSIFSVMCSGKIQSNKPFELLQKNIHAQTSFLIEQTNLDSRK